MKRLFPALLGAALMVAMASAPVHAQKGSGSAQDIVTADSMSMPQLKSVLEAAMFTVSEESNGDLVVNDRGKTIVRLAKDRIWLACFFRFKDDVPMLSKLELANRLNDSIIIVRSAVPSHETNELELDYDILLSGGVTKAAIVAAIKRFIDTSSSGVVKYDTDDIVR